MISKHFFRFLLDYESATVHELEAHTTLIKETVWEVRASMETTDALRWTCVE